MTTNQEFVNLEETLSPIEDMTELSFSLSIDDVITLSISSDSTHSDGDVSVEVVTEGDCSVSLKTLTVAIKELTRFSSTYYPLEEDDSTPVQTPAEVQS